MSVVTELISDGILTVTLNRPEVMNALDTSSKERLGEIWAQANKEPDVRVVVLRGAGEKAFCAGSDIKEIRRTGRMVTTEMLYERCPESVLN